MGSLRSSSTAYSSKGNRHNSVYSTSETADAGGMQLGPPSASKKFYGFSRKSSRKQRLFKRGECCWGLRFIIDEGQTQIHCIDRLQTPNRILTEVYLVEH